MKIRFLAVITAAMLLAGCSETQEESVATTAETAVTTQTEADHSLLRGFTISEAYEDITAAGMKIPFPLPLSELEAGGALEGCKYENGTLYFPDGSSAEAEETDGVIRKLTFNRGTAPADFSIMHLTLGATYDIVYATGIPDKGFDRDGYKFVEYLGVPGQWIHLDFNENILTTISLNELW